MAEEDMIFGKNRHLFGGIEPSNLRVFTVEKNGSSAFLTVTFPLDTIIDSQTLCTVAGAVIRRSYNGYPKNEFDGELIADVKSDVTTMIIADDNVDLTRLVYYAAFPYTTQGVYNRNGANRASLNAPTNNGLTSIAAYNSYDYTTGKCKVDVNLGIEHSYSLSGCMIRYSANGFPKTMEDGTLLIDMSPIDKTTIPHENIDPGIVMYYTAFPYDSNGNCDYGSMQHASVKCVAYNYLYGYDLDTTNSDPDARVSYPSDVDNANFDPAYMDFTLHRFNYGGWNLEPGEHFMPRPCILRSSGTVTFLNPNNYYKTLNGDDISLNENLDGNAMVQWPKIYTKRWEENGIYHFRCSDAKIDEDYECWCNYDANNEVRNFYMGAFLGYVDSNNKLRSICSYTPKYSATIEHFNNYANNNGGSRYRIEMLSQRLLIQDLLVMMGKSTDTQGTYGTGNSNGSNRLNTGQHIYKGMFYGTNDRKSSVKVFGMEDYWGNYEQFIAGLYVIPNNLTLSYKITPGNKDGTNAAFTYNGTANPGYKTEKFTNSVSNINFYIKKMITTPYGRLPSYEDGGSGSTYECDHCYYYPTGAPRNVHYAVVGGDNSDNLMCGAFKYEFQAYASSQTYIAARLTYL